MEFKTRSRRINLLCSVILIIMVPISALFARWDDPEYHSNDEILQELVSLRDSLLSEGRNYMRIDTIGYSQQDHLPILAVLISDDVDISFPERPPRPAVVYNGSVHAEEMLGNEYVLYFIKKVIRRGRPYRIWRETVDLWAIPTTNPEGLNVVYSLDNTYRKNKRDNIGDGVFRYKPDWGSDTSGVDINRNFPTFWINGDVLFKLGSKEAYDYYRGPSPASEAETRTLIAFYDKIRPLYSNTIHTSRTGLFSEKVIYPWLWGPGDQGKRAPDFNFLTEMGNQIALRCDNFSGSGAYEAVPIGNPRGDSEQFYYYTFGTFGVRVEIGQKGDGMQPDSGGMYKVFEDVSLGMEWMMRSASAEENSDDLGDILASRLNIRVSDEDGNPLYARIKLDSRSSPIIPCRFTNPHNGMYYWMVDANLIDTLRVSRFGYRPWISRVTGTDRPSDVNGRNGIRLERLDVQGVTLNINTNGIPLTDPVELRIVHSDTTWNTLFTGGSKILDLPEGNYTLELHNGLKHVPRIIDILVNDADTTWEYNIELSEANTLLAQNFDGANLVFSCDTTINRNHIDSLSRWERTTNMYHTPPACLTDSRKGNTPIFDDSWFAPYNILQKSFDLSNVENAALVYWINQALEPGHDSLWVEFSSVNAEGTQPSKWKWTQVAPAHQSLAILNWQDRQLMEQLENISWNSPRPNYMHFHDWERVIIPLDDFAGKEEVHFRFHLSTDFFLQTDGVYIDDIYLLTSGDAPAFTTNSVFPEYFQLDNPYPNPFNSQLKAFVHLPQSGDLNISLHDLNGRIVWQDVNHSLEAGSHNIHLDAGGLASGLYILRVGFYDQIAFRKTMLIK